MTDHIEAARKVLQGPYEWQTVGDLRILAKPSDIVDELDRAGLLRTGHEKEVMLRLTATARAMLDGEGIVGQRIGIAPDFDRLTPLHERALRACEAFHVAWPHAADGGSYSERVVAGIGRESLALKQPKPRWTAEILLERHRLLLKHALGMARHAGYRAGYGKGFQDAREAAAKECETLKVKYEATRECAAAIRALSVEAPPSGSTLSREGTLSPKAEREGERRG
jgi:hypothetical protein